jgi:hypothetical protein
MVGMESFQPPTDFPTAFDDSFAALRRAVAMACAQPQPRPGRIAAATFAALEFVVAEPAAAQTLTVDSLANGPYGALRYRRAIDHFAELLREVAPRNQYLPDTTERALIGGTAMLIANHLLTNRLERLRGLGPELVEFILLPYFGRAEARRWARPPPPGGT